MKSLVNYLVPQNTKGKPTDIEHSITMANIRDARDAFKRASERMLTVNSWHTHSGLAGADFVLRNEQGEEAGGLAIVGDYFQIDIPGPGPSSGDGYDWVQVEAIENKINADAEEESIGMRVRSCKNPNKPRRDTAHFFTNEATSTFIIHRKGETVYSLYHGRNEVLNTDTTKLKDRIRNTIIGAGAMAGISELQWSRLTKSFLDKEV